VLPRLLARRETSLRRRQFAVKVALPGGRPCDLPAGGAGHATGFDQQELVDAHLVLDVDGAPHGRLHLVDVGPSERDAAVAFGDDDEPFGLLPGQGGRGDVAAAARRVRLVRGALAVLRVGVAAVHDDEVLDAARDVQLAVVDDAVVAGLHPGARREFPGIGQCAAERVLAAFGVAPVAGGRVGAVHPDLAGPAVRLLDAGVRV